MSDITLATPLAVLPALNRCFDAQVRSNLSAQQFDAAHDTFNVDCTA